MKEFWCFCAKDWKFWRVKWYIQHAGSVVFYYASRVSVFV